MTNEQNRVDEYLGEVRSAVDARRYLEHLNTCEACLADKWCSAAQDLAERVVMNQVESDL